MRARLRDAAPSFAALNDNGVQVNGIQVYGIQVNGLQFNGSFNGVTLKGCQRVTASGTGATVGKLGGVARASCPSPKTC